MDTDPMCTKYFTSGEQNKMVLCQKVYGLNKFQRNAMVRYTPCRNELEQKQTEQCKLWE